MQRVLQHTNKYIMIDLRQGDCLKVMNAIESGSVDAIITDPPYGTTQCKWDSVIDLKLMWQELNRIVKPNGAIVLFSAQPFTSSLISSNYKSYKYSWYWLKNRATGVLNAKKQPNISYHTIISRCAYFNYFYPELKIYMKFNEEEHSYIKKIVNELPAKFIIIEPHAKTSWCVHKQYPIEKWQKVIDGLYKKVPFVQMSMPDKLVMKNVINVGNKMRGFRDCALFLKYACLFVGTEGGFMHAAQVHGTKCVCLFTSMFDPVWTKYPNDEALWVVEGGHKNCFVEGTCNKCLKAMNNYDSGKIINKIKKII